MLDIDRRRIFDSFIQSKKFGGVKKVQLTGGMIKMKLNAIRNSTLAGLFLLSAGCVTPKIPMTASLIQEYDLGPEQLMKLQYYVSDDIVLARGGTDREAGVHEAGVRLVSNRVVDYVVVPYKTPGIAVNASKDRLEIAFEEGSSFSFSVAKRPTGYRGSEPRYGLVPERVVPLAERGEFGPFVYTYREKEYFSENGASVYLLVAESTIENVKKTKYRMEGLKLPE